MDLFDPIQFDTTTIKKQLITYKPNLESYSYNDRIKITVNSSTFTELYNSHIYLRITVKSIPQAAANAKIAFVQNGVLQLFSDCILEQNNVTLEWNRQPGLTNLVMSLLVMDKDDSSGSTEYGFDTFTATTDNTFDLTIPLKHLLNFARDYKKFMIYSRFDLTLVRARNDHNAVICGEAGAADKVEIDIDKVSWVIPHIMINDVLKLKILKSVEHGKDIYMPFRSFEYHEYTSIPTSSTQLSWMVKSAVKRPLYAMAIFLTDKYYNLKTNNSNFDNLNVRSIRLWVNALAYPFEPLDLDFTKNYFADAYKMYKNMRMAMEDKKGAMMTKAEFSNKFPVYCFDLSHYDYDVEDSVNDVKLDVEFRAGPPAKTNLILLLMYENLFSYNPFTNIVSKEI